MAPKKVGDTIPDGTVHWFDENDELQKLSIQSLAAGKKILIMGVPGATTPTFSMDHLPLFIPSAEKLKFKGVDELVLIGVSDPLLMKAWAKRYPDYQTRMKFLADKSASILGLEVDPSEKEPPVNILRLEVDPSEKEPPVSSHWFAILLEDLKVKAASNFKEGGGHFTVSDAEEILESL